MPIRLDTLGTLRIVRDGQELERLPAQPVRCAVLLYLALEREAARDAVLGMFWPESAPDQARHALNQTLYELRRMLGDDWVDMRGDRLHASDRVEVDALEFTEAVERGDAPFALGLYRGEFLGGASPATTRAFEGWVDQWNARLGRLHRRACREAIDQRVAADDLPGAVQLARRWTDLDPLDDEAQHRLIEVLARSGDRSEALRQYERYERLVREELELEPLDETKELVEQIRAGTLNGNGSTDGESPEAEQAPEPAGDEAPAHDPTPVATGARVTPSGHAAADGSAPEAPATPGPPAEERSFGARARFELRRRHVIAWTMAYVAAALATFEAVQNLASTYGWSPAVTRELPVLLAFGAVAAIVLAWYHGAAGWQRVTPTEAGILAVLAIGALAFATRTGERPPPSTTAAVADLDLAHIAVLPFADLSEKGDLKALAGQITDGLIDQLAQVPVFYVQPRFATERFAGGTTPFDSMVKSLRAGAIVEGSVMRAGEDYQVTVQLVDVTTPDSVGHLTSDKFTTSTTQADPAAAVVRMAKHTLLRTLHAELEKRAMHARASNEQAWQLFQHARNVENVEAGETKAIWNDDPAAALALLGQADSLLALAGQIAPHWLDPLVERANVASLRAKKTAKLGDNFEPGATQQAIAFLDQALQRDPEYVPALAARGLLRYHLAENLNAARGDTLNQRATADLRHAVRIDTLQAEAWEALAKIDHRYNNLNAAASDALRALRADVFQENTLEYTWNVFVQVFNLEDRDRSEYWCNQLEERIRGSYAAYCRMFLISAMPGVPPDVNLAWKLAGRMRADAALYSRIFVAKTLARAGLPDSARAVLRRTVPPPSDSVPKWAPYDAAHAWLMLGDRQKALQYLKIYAKLKPIAARSLAVDWLFQPLWSDPTYQQLAGGRTRG